MHKVYTVGTILLTEQKINRTTEIRYVAILSLCWYYACIF